MLKEDLLTLINIIGQLKTYAHGCQLILASGVPAEYLAYNVKDIPPVLRKLSIDVQHTLNTVKIDTMSLAPSNPTAKSVLRELLRVADDLSDELCQACDIIWTDPGEFLSDPNGDVKTLRDVWNLHFESLYAVTKRCHKVESVLNLFVDCLSTPSDTDQTSKED